MAVDPRQFPRYPIKACLTLSCHLNAPAWSQRVFNVDLFLEKRDFYRHLCMMLQKTRFCRKQSDQEAWFASPLEERWSSMWEARTASDSTLSATTITKETLRVKLDDTGNTSSESSSQIIIDIESNRMQLPEWLALHVNPVLKSLFILLFYLPIHNDTGFSEIRSVDF